MILYKQIIGTRINVPNTQEEHMKKRLLSLCLALVMTLGLFVSAIPAASAAKAKTLPFRDVTSSDWFCEYVKFVYERDLMKGVSGTEFGPNSSMTRGQIVTILSRMSGDNVEGAKSSLNFNDVDPNMYYADPIGWAVKNGIAKGKGVGKFDPDAPVLRQEFAAFFVRYMKYKGIEFPGKKVTPFPDKDIPDWAKEDVETLHSVGLVTGDAKGYYNPTKKMTRAEIATVVMRFVQTAESLPGDDTGDTSDTGENPPQPPTDALKNTVEAYLDENLCLAHYKLDFVFNYTAGLTEEALLALFVLAGDVGFAEEHEVVYVIACLKEEAADGAVGDLVIGDGDGAHVQRHQLLHILHPLVHRQLQAPENLRHHLLTDIVVVVKGPSELCIPSLGLGLANIVEESCPAEPEAVVCSLCAVSAERADDVGQHFQRMP